MWQAFDLAGNPRILPRTSDWRVDRGAYEYVPPSFRPVTIVVNLAGDAQLRWRSKVGRTYVVWSTLDLLSGDWTEEGTVVSEGALTSWIDLDTLLYPWKFYRIESR